jgi:hypothetical protein
MLNPNHPQERSRRRCNISMLTSVVFFMGAAIGSAQTMPSNEAAQDVFRQPFDLKLRIDNEHYYQEHLEKIPYVSGGNVYLFIGERFGINLTIQGDRITHVAYQPDLAKADMTFAFSQEKADNGLMTLLTTRNKTSHRIFLDALMTVPQSKDIHSTTILPIDAGLSNYESWPHPIVQLVLTNIRLSRTRDP